MTWFMLIGIWLGGATAPDSLAETGGWYQYASPEQAGFDGAALDAVFQTAEAGKTAAMMVIYDGKVLAAWGNVDSRYKCHSVRKSMYSAVIGMLVDEGQLDLDKTVAAWGIEDIHGLSEAERQATFRHLISARSGVYHPAAKEPVSMKRSRPQRGSHAPGTHFFYNNWDFNLSAMLAEQASGEEFFDLFRQRLAEPLGFQDYRDRDGFHEYDRSASKFPAHAFRLSARDMARVGQLYLQRGVWNGERLLSEAWIDESTAAISDTGGMGYGYMWWVLGDDPEFPRKRRLYMASGTGGQAILVDEEARMVVVHRGDTDHGRDASSGEMMAMYRDILRAQTGKPAANPRLVPMEPKPLAGRLPALDDIEIATISESALVNKTGKYRMPDGAVVTLRRHDDFLIGGHSVLGEIDLFPVAETEFRAYNANIGVRFTMDDNGGIARATLNLNGQQIPVEPLP